MRIKQLIIKIFKAASQLGTAALLFYAGYAYPQEERFSCRPAKEMIVKNLADEYAYLATMITDRTVVVQIYVNLHNGKWRIIGIDNDQNACQLMQGDDFIFAMGRII